MADTPAWWERRQAGTMITVRANPFTNSGTVLELNGGKIIVNP